MANEILVGYDGSDCAQAALSAALEIAGEMSGNVVVAYGAAVSPLGGEVKDYADALEEQGRKVLDEAVAKARADGVEVEGEFVKEEPAWALAELAEKRGSRVIVVGSRGESPLRGAILGSTPHKLLQIAKTPVLVVPLP